jgi:hypothetical protein
MKTEALLAIGLIGLILLCGCISPSGAIESKYIVNEADTYETFNSIDLQGFIALYIAQDSWQPLGTKAEGTCSRCERLVWRRAG